MAIVRYISAQDIINRTAAECGLTPVNDVWASTDPAFVQLRSLLTSCGQNLTENYEWEILRREYRYTTIDCDIYVDHGAFSAGSAFVVGETLTGGTSGATGVVVEVGDGYVALSGVTGTFADGEDLEQTTPTATAPITDIRDNGEFNLPVDFDRMIDQTHWERTNRYPMAGPLTAQQWQYLLGMQMAGMTIYVNFRVFENRFNILPMPPPAGLELVYEYTSRNWVKDPTDPDEFYDEVSANDQIVLFKPEVIIQFLRFKFLSAKGFATKGAQDAFGKAYENATGADKGAPILNAGMRRRFGMMMINGLMTFHLLDWYNIPDTGYGSVDPDNFILQENEDLIELEDGSGFLEQE